MRITVDFICYNVKIDPEDLTIAIDKLNLAAIKESFMTHPEILKCAVDDLGPFLWLTLNATADSHPEFILNLIKTVFQDYLVDK